MLNMHTAKCQERIAVSPAFIPSLTDPLTRSGTRAPLGAFWVPPCSTNSQLNQTTASSKGMSKLASKNPAAKEPAECSHPVNFGGLCGVCGKDLTEESNSDGQREDSQVAIQMTHENSMLFVSKAEAARLENETSLRLLKGRRLSLILDLDQTVIHATVDASLERWLASPLFSAHPNLQDVYKFQLDDNNGFYHVKLRPGLREFLEVVAQLYELHIYTMGTRKYAAAVARIIDPAGLLFKERILSRDESGSFTQKSISRLFPCDDSMVVVVDDRADVWNWCDNLIKVRPYSFFCGTGDINAPPKLASPVVIAEASADTATTVNALESTSEVWKDLMESELPPPVQEDSSVAPALQAEVEPEVSSDDLLALPAPFLLEDPDKELGTLSHVLQNLQAQFYAKLDSIHDVASLGMAARCKLGLDTKTLLNRMKRQVLDGCHLVLSGIVPIGQPPETCDIWRLATSFGASIQDAVDDSTTHVISAKWGTQKVMEARKVRETTKPNLWIVRSDWLLESVQAWNRRPEYKYVLEAPPSEQEDNGTTLQDVRPSSGLSFTFENEESYLDDEQIKGIGQELLDELGDAFTDDDESLQSERVSLDYDGEADYEDRSQDRSVIEEGGEEGDSQVMASLGSNATKLGKSAETGQDKRTQQEGKNVKYIPRRISPLRNVAFSISRIENNQIGTEDESPPLSEDNNSVDSPRVKKRKQPHPFSGKKEVKRRRDLRREMLDSSVSEDGSDFDLDAFAAELDADWDQ